MKRASSDVGFIFIAYNLKRIMNIIGLEQLMEILTKILTNNSMKYSIKYSIRRRTDIGQLKPFILNISNNLVIVKNIIFWSFKPKSFLGF